MSPGPPPSAGVPLIGDRHGVGGKAAGTLEGRSVLYGRVAADDYDYPYLAITHAEKTLDTPFQFAAF
jgi:hypothetical protein